jgi:hypothetical protein
MSIFFDGILQAAGSSPLACHSDFPCRVSRSAGKADQTGPGIHVDGCCMLPVAVAVADCGRSSRGLSSLSFFSNIPGICYYAVLLLSAG